jgi:myo-inositol-1(or 4)-monophosphatase
MTHTFLTQWQVLRLEVMKTAQKVFDQVNQGSQQSDRKSDGSLITETDLALQNAISACLLKHFPHIPVLGEEMTEKEQQAVLATGNCWLLDPLDGTSNFSHGIPVYAVSCALLQQGEVVAGMVYDPNRSECFHAVRGHGAWLNEQSLQRNTAEQTGQLKHAMAIIDTKRLEPNLAQAIGQEHPYHSQRSFGSVALDWCWLAQGRIQTYLHGKQKLWDFAAGALIAEESRCIAQTLCEEPILKAPLSLDARSAVGACPALAKAWPEWIKQHR